MTTIVKPLHREMMLWLFAGLISAAHAQEKNMPDYLAHRADPVQKEYSAVLLGFAFEKKCTFLAEAKRVDYERFLDVATATFQGYALAKGMVQSPDQAVEYAKDMIFGSIRFAATSTCDATAEEHINEGFEAARDFGKVIDGAPAK